MAAVVKSLFLISEELYLIEIIMRLKLFMIRNDN